MESSNCLATHPPRAQHTVRRSGEPRDTRRRQGLESSSRLQCCAAGLGAGGLRVLTGAAVSRAAGERLGGGDSLTCTQQIRPLEARRWVLTQVALTFGQSLTQEQASCEAGRWACGPEEATSPCLSFPTSEGGTELPLDQGRASGGRICRHRARQGMARQPCSHCPRVTAPSWSLELARSKAQQETDRVLVIAGSW